MIERIHFQNYKALQNVQLDFGRLTVLVGANACGKSTVLKGIEWLYATADAETDEAWWLRTEAQLRDRATLGQHGRIAVTAFFSEGGEVALALAPGTKAGRLSIRLDNDTQDAPMDALKGFIGVLPRTYVEYLNLEPKLLAAPSAEAELEPDGRHLAGRLADLALNQPQVLDRIRSQLAAVVPGVRYFRFPKVRLSRSVQESIEVKGHIYSRLAEHEYWGNRLEVEFEDLGWVSADDLSEGTLNVLGLLTALHGSIDRNYVVLIDDIDRGLHPRAQAELIACLRRILDLRPELQVICTTHSPFLLNHFNEDEVRVMGLDAHRHARVRPLTAHPEWARWRSMMQVGEFWSAVGDDWVALDGVAPPEAEASKGEAGG